MINETKTLKAIAYKPEFNTSDVNSAQYSIIVWKGELDASPASPVAGWGYYDKTQKKSFIYDGAKWSILAQDGKDALVSSSKISVKIDGKPIENGYEFDFGESREQTFTIENVGSAALMLYGKRVYVFGKGFFLTKDATTDILMPGEKTSFTVNFLYYLVFQNLSESFAGNIGIFNTDPLNTPFTITIKGKSKSFAIEDYDALPDSDPTNDIHIEGSFVTWGGLYTPGANSTMKKISPDIYVKRVTVTADESAFVPSWVSAQSPTGSGANACFKLRTGNKWGHETGAFGPDYGSTADNANLITLRAFLTIKENKVDGGAGNLWIKLEKGKSYLFYFNKCIPEIIVFEE